MALKETQPDSSQAVLSWAVPEGWLRVQIDAPHFPTGPLPEGDLPGNRLGRWRLGRGHVHPPVSRWPGTADTLHNAQPQGNPGASASPRLDTNQVLYSGTRSWGGCPSPTCALEATSRPGLPSAVPARLRAELSPQNHPSKAPLARSKDTAWAGPGP